MLDLFKLQLGQTQTPLPCLMAWHCVCNAMPTAGERTGYTAGYVLRAYLDAHVERDGVHENGLAINTAYHARVFRSRIWPTLTQTC